MPCCDRRGQHRIWCGVRPDSRLPAQLGRSAALSEASSGLGVGHRVNLDHVIDCCFRYTRAEAEPAACGIVLSVERRLVPTYSQLLI
jgi:hypothetical protein